LRKGRRKEEKATGLNEDIKAPRESDLPYWRSNNFLEE
jgi:hypothetical protein